MNMTVRETESFTKWTDSLKDQIAQALIAARIRRISAGNFGDSKSVGGGDKYTQTRDIEAAKRIAKNIEEE